jgi:hypothetical protein
MTDGDADVAKFPVYILLTHRFPGIASSVSSVT